MAKKKQDNTLKYIGLSLLFIIKIPYYLIRSVVFLIKRSKKAVDKQKIRKKRKDMKANYTELKVIETLDGDFEDFEEDIINSDSKIGIIIGARGSGKTAFGMKFMENLFSKTKKQCFALGFKEDELPSFIKVVNETSELKNDSFVLIDEGGILFSARKSMSNANKLLSDLILIARHKNLTILFISQNSSNLDVNILRQADFIVLKPSSLLQINFERKIIQKIYEDTKESFDKFKKLKGLTYIYSDPFRGFISNPLPSFWNKNISKSFR